MQSFPNEQRKEIEEKTIVLISMNTRQASAMFDSKDERPNEEESVL